MRPSSGRSTPSCARLRGGKRIRDGHPQIIVCVNFNFHPGVIDQFLNGPEDAGRTHHPDGVRIADSFYPGFDQFLREREKKSRVGAGSVFKTDRHFNIPGKDEIDTGEHRFGQPGFIPPEL